MDRQSLEAAAHFAIERQHGVSVLRLRSADGANRLTRACVASLTQAVLSLKPQPFLITGNHKFFSAGADLAEIGKLSGPEAREFSLMGQRLMSAIAEFPGPVYAAIHGYCMGGGLDLALACHRRIAAPSAIFGHRGAALGLMTGWGGTQRLPRLVGKARALEMFVSAEKLHVRDALRMGLIDAIAEDPVTESVTRIQSGRTS